MRGGHTAAAIAGEQIPGPRIQLISSGIFLAACLTQIDGDPGLPRSGPALFSLFLHLSPALTMHQWWSSLLSLLVNGARHG